MLFQRELLVFGGVYPNPDPQPDSCSNELYIFNTGKMWLSYCRILTYWTSLLAANKICFCWQPAFYDFGGAQAPFTSDIVGPTFAMDSCEKSLATLFGLGHIMR
jgi:hypothetical protein